MVAFFCIALMSLHSFYFWLAAFPDDHQHEKASPLGMRRHTLECPGWMQQRQLGVGHGGKYPAQTILALCQGEISENDFWTGPLTMISPEQSVLFRFWQFPTDGVFVRVKSVKPLTPENCLHIPESIVAPHVRCDDKVWRPSSRRTPFIKPSPTTMPFKPWLLASHFACALQEVGASLSPMEVDDMFVLPQPQSICHLILQQAWSSILCMGRWNDFVATFPERLQQLIGPTGANEPTPSKAELTVSGCVDLANHIRRWAEPVLNSQQDAGSKESEHMKLEGAVQWLENLAANIPRTDVVNTERKGWLKRCSKQVYSSLFMVKALLLMRLIPGSVDMRSLLVDAVMLLFPNLLRSVCERLLADPHVFPGSGQRHQARLVLDAALLFWRRADTRAYVRFGGADASPQCGYDFLLSSSDYILKTEIVPTFMAVQRMMQEANIRTTMNGEQSGQSIADHFLVRRNILKEDDLPIALGHSAASTSEKCAAMMYKWFLRCDSRDALAEYMESFFSYTADMGTEIHMAGFHLRAIDDLLPAWMQPQAISSDVEPGYATFRLPTLESDVAETDHLPITSEVKDQVQYEPPLQDDFKSGLFLPNALVIPGILHITSNALQQLSDHLDHFPVFFEQLKMIEHLWKKGRLCRFINFCVHPVATPDVASQFQARKLGSLYLKRWNEVVRFCLRLKDLLPLLAAFWDEERFNYCRQANADAEFNPTELTRILQDRFFRAYFDMVLALATILEELGQWCEKCPCHHDLLCTADFSRKRKHNEEDANTKTKTTIPKLYGSSSSYSCPMRGKMFPELVGDGLRQIVSGLASRGSLSLLLAHKPQLTQQQWTMLMRDFEKGKATIDLELSVKLSFCEQLPWRLALLAHTDLAMARRELSKVVYEYDSLPTSLQQHHHALTRKTLDKSRSIRAEFDAFLGGQNLLDLPQLLELAASFRFVQITERYFEASHAIVKRKVNPNGAGPVVSLTRRLFRLANDISINPGLLDEVAQHYQVARDLKSLPARLGLAGHPDLSPFCGQKRVNWKIVKVLNKVLYRTDTAGQFTDVRGADEYDRKQSDQLQNMGEKLVKKYENRILQGPQRGTYESLRLEALQDHISLLAEERPHSLFHLQIAKDQLPDAVQDFVQGVKMHSLALDSDVDAGHQVQSVQQESDDHMASLFFEIVNTRPSSRRVVEASLAATLSSKLKTRDLAINTYAVHLSCDSVPWLKCSPKEGATSAVQVMRDLSQIMLFDDLCRNLRVGESGEQMLYFVQAEFDVGSNNAKRIAELISILIDSCAFPNLCDAADAKTWHSFGDLPDSDLAILTQLVEKGYLEQNDNGDFRGTAAMLADLQLCRPFHEKDFAFNVCLSSPSTHQLLTTLEKAGFEWRRIKPKEIMYYTIGEKKEWGTRGVTVCKEFLQCLLEAETLQRKFGLERIPCIGPKSTYLDILNGKIRDFPSVPDVPAQAAVQLLPDLELYDGSPGGHFLGPEEDIDLDKSDEQIDNLMELLSNSQEAEACVETAPAENSSSSPPVAVDDSAARDAIDKVVPNVTVAPSPLNPENAPASSGEGAGNAPASSSAVPRLSKRLEGTQLENFSWGAFRFTYKQTNKQFSLQATCPFHARNFVTGCKKSINITPFTSDRLQEVTLLLKHWCNNARSYERQSTHLAMRLNLKDCPDPSIVESQIIPAAQKPDAIKTDKELDDLLPQAKAKSQPVAKAKGKPKSKPKAKSKVNNQNHSASSNSDDSESSNVESSSSDSSSDSSSSS